MTMIQRRDVLRLAPVLAGVTLAPSLARANQSLKIEGLKVDPHPHYEGVLSLSCSWSVPQLINYRQFTWNWHDNRGTERDEMVQILKHRIALTAASELLYVDAFGDCLGAGIHGGCRHGDMLEWMPRRRVDRSLEWRSFLSWLSIKPVTVEDWLEGQRRHFQEIQSGRSLMGDAYSVWWRSHYQRPVHPRDGSTLIVHDGEGKPFQGEVLYQRCDDSFPSLGGCGIIPESFKGFGYFVGYTTKHETRTAVSDPQDPGAFHAKDGIGKNFWWQLKPSGGSSVWIGTQMNRPFDESISIGKGYTARVVDHLG